MNQFFIIFLLFFSAPIFAQAEDTEFINVEASNILDAADTLRQPDGKNFINVNVSGLLETVNLRAVNATISGNLLVKGAIIGAGGSSLGSVSTQGPTTTNAVAIFANSSGTLLKNSPVLIDSAGNITINGITKAGNTVSWPSIVGAAGTVLTSDGAGNLVYSTPGGGGNVSTALPFSSNNVLLTTDTPSGVDNIKQSGVTLDGSNNISGVNTLSATTVNATTFNGALNGNATSATNFTGPLVGDVIGTQGATVVSTVGGQTATNVAAATVLANAATSNNTGGAIVRRDGSGNFSATTITANLTGNATTATTATNSTNFTGSLAGDVTGTQSATVVSTVGGQSAANIASGAVAANAATNLNTASTIVKRDGSGNFSAGTITAALNGNATTATTATTAVTATNATNFTGSLAGDVTGTQGATVVSFVGGQSAANVASGVVAANAATNTNTASTIVKRDASGNFAAGTITASLTGNVTGNLTGNASTATTATNATNFTGSLVGDVTGTQGATIVSAVGGQTASAVAAGTVLANASTASNTASTIVRRDGSGSFAAGTVTANSFVGPLTGNVTGNLTGNATTATSATTATTATNFTGSLVGDVTGTQGATVVSLVGGQSAANVAAATVKVGNATANDTPNTLVLRDGSGNFATNMITIDGTVTNPTDVATKDYVDNAVSTGFTVHPPAIVYSATDVSLSGTQTIDGVDLVSNDRVLLNGQVDQVENGLWLVQTSSWTRPTDFATGTQAGTAYVLTTSGVIFSGTSWVCTTPTAIIDTDPISFAQFSTQGSVTGANVGTGDGHIFRDKTGNTLNFKTLSAGQDIIITNNTNEVNIATDGTPLNNPNTLVQRDPSGNFAAGTITASLTGAASLNVLKAGDTMTGNLNMAAQSEVRLQDAVGGQYIGLNAPTTVGTSYTVNLPATAPTAGQVLQATSPTATAWTTSGGGAPAASKTFYVSVSGSDSNDGSFNAPFLTIKHALAVVNPQASAGNPIVISVGAGLFFEDNSGGPLTISADGISLIGSSISATTVFPLNVAGDLFSITTATTEMSNMTLAIAFGTSTAAAINLTSDAVGIVRFTLVAVGGYQTGFSLNSGTGSPVALFESVQTGGNGTSIEINNTQAVIQNALMAGPLVAADPATNTGMLITGTSAQVLVTNSTLSKFGPAGISVTGGARLRLLATNFEGSANDIVCAGSSITTIVGCNFILGLASSTDIMASGAGTQVIIDGCHFDGNDASGTRQGTSIKSTTGALVFLTSSLIENTVVALQCGAPGDTISTALRANSVTLFNCTTDVQQNGSSLLRFVSGIFDQSIISIADPTNVNFSSFDRDHDDVLAFGSNTDEMHALYEILNGQSTLPNLSYQPNYYGHKGTAYINANANPTFNATQSNVNNANYYVITGDRTKTSAINLISDTNSTVGSGNNVRGWEIAKTGATADLTFTYTNNDSSSQAIVGPYVAMQLNGSANQIEFPTATSSFLPTNTVARLVWASDTNLYRAATNSLKTDSNFSVGALNTAGVVHNDSTGLLSTSLIVNADVSPTAGIVDTKLATIATAGKVANSATTATSANTPSTIVLRDGLGDFSANTVTASLTGTASGNVLKTGDTMTGNLNMAAQSEVRFQDAAGGQYVGLNAPATVGTSYTVNLPATAPTAGQVLQATSPTATVWTTSGGGAPAASKTFYVSVSGSDSNDGSFNAPFLTIRHALTVVNPQASTGNPIVISVGAGLFFEDNSGGPLTISSDGISLIGSSISATTVFPLNVAGDLFSITTATTEMSNMTLAIAFGTSTAAAVNLTSDAVGIVRFTFVAVGGYQTGFSLNSGTGNPVALFESVQTGGNGTSIAINNTQAVIQNALMAGPLVAVDPATNTGMLITGTSAQVLVTNSTLSKFGPAGISVTGGARLRLLATNFEGSANDIVCAGSSITTVGGCNFILGLASSTDIMASGAGTQVIIDGCHFDGKDASATRQGTSIKSTTGALVFLTSCLIENAVVGLQCGAPGDTISTVLRANSITLFNCTTDVQQNGSSLLRFLGGVFDQSAISIADPTNVNFGAFDRTNNDDLAFGSNSDLLQQIYEILNGQPTLPLLVYNPNYYGHKGTAYINANANPTFNATQSNVNNANYYVITGDRTKTSAINLISDTNSTVGSGANVRGWEISKVATTADLAFTYTNNDTSGQAARGFNTVMQLDGFNNLVKFPLAINSPLPTNTVAQLVWAGDTNLYRSATNTLKTDSNFSVGTLNSVGVVHNDATGLLSTSLIVNADISPTAGIVDTKLATIITAGKVANSATTATSANTPSTIVLRDSSGDFSANTVTASLTGTASGNVLKTGDTMSGNLNMAAQSELRFQDATGGEYVGLNAPTTVPTSYTVNLPAVAPTAGQLLQATSPTATTWTTSGGGVPAVSKTYYVSKGGSDSNDGSFNAPFLTVSHAVTVANTVASTLNPVVIKIGAGLFVENNSGGPITISANGITIFGSSNTGTIIVPTTLSNNLFACTTSNVLFSTLALDSGSNGGSTASGVSVVAPAGQGGFQSVIISRFQTGLSLSGSITVPQIVLANVVVQGNSTGIAITDARIIIENCVFLGALSGSTPANTAITITGTNALVTLLANSLRLLGTGISATGGSNVRMLGTNIETTTNSLVASGASNVAVVGCNFIFNNASSINVNASGANTAVTLDGCQFQCHDASNVPQGVAIQLTNAASVLADSCAIESPVIGIVCGTTGDTSTTSLKASGVTIVNGVADIVQEGSSMLQFVAGTFDETKITIADPTNVSFAAFNNDAELVIGNSVDSQHTIFNVLNGQTTLPSLTYEPNYYGSKGLAYINANANPTFNATQGNLNNANYYVITGDRTKTSSINLISDTNSTVGSGANVRGWGISKVATTADLAFTYTNNDTSGQAARGLNTVMQLDGFNNLVNFPLATNSPLPTNTVAQLVWAGDTNLYRSTTNTLKTDSNFSVGALSTAGVVHNDATGLLSTSLIVNADVSPTAGIVDTKLATIITAGKVANSATTATSTGTPSTIVLRDGSSNFATNMITLNGTTTNATDAATKSYVDTAVSTGFTVHPAAVVYSATNITLSGTQTIDDVALVANDRVLLNGQTDPIENGLWLVQVGAWTRPTDFSNGTTAGSAYVLITSGTVFAGTSWVCATPTAIIGTDSISFAQFSEQSSITGANVGVGAGQIFRDKIGNTLNFKTIAAGTHITVTNNTNDVTIGTDATSANTASTIVARDGSGNFAAGTITAALAGNATTATTATNFSGSLVGNVTGTQGATVVATVGGQSAANVASGVVAANAATDTNTASTIVKRDASGNFAAGTITASLTGNVTGNLTGNATTATTATTATNFTGSLVGDVTGTQGATVVSTVGGQTASAVAAATVLANAATSANTASTIVRRDASGNFSATTITAALSGNATTATTATNFSGSLVGDVTGTQGATVVSTVGGQSAANVASGAVLANAATNLNTANQIVKRDGSGNFVAGTITAALNGNATTATSATTATTATTATNFSGSLVGDVTGTQGATVVSTVGGQTAANVAAGTVLANAATNTNTVNQIVKRDASGNFAAGTVTATSFVGPLTGNVTGNATTATTATTATNFSGSLVGDVTGTQGATVVSTVGGQTASAVAAATVLANAATSANTASTIVRRDASGNFSATTITAALSGNATTATTATNFSGSLVGDVTGTQGATVVSTVGGQTAANVASGAVLANAATNLNTANQIVKRDGSGNFVAGTITAALNGNATTATSATTATTATTATNFSGSLVGDVTGTQGATVVSTVGGQTAANVAAGTVLANNATNTNTVNQIVRRDASGDFAAGTITATSFVGPLTGNVTGNATTATTATTATNFSGSLVGDVTGTQGATVVSTVGGQTSSAVAAATVLANAATSANTASAIVRRDASGDFSAGTVSATTFVGALTGAASLNVLKAGDTMTGTLTHPAGTAAAPSIQFTGSTNTGFSALTANTISFDSNGVEQMTISPSVITVKDSCVFTDLISNQAVQTANPASSTGVTAAATTSILLLTITAARTNVTITFPPNPTNGQYFTIVDGSVFSITLINAAGTGGAAIVNPVTTLAPATNPTASANGAAVTYYYNSTNNAWYRIGRG